ncbi:MAG: diheme cytochrome c [Deltaproteobacteria bacterium]|nr:diheme cytochrome c [Deltaproteobacteria bacterium]
MESNLKTKSIQRRKSMALKNRVLLAGCLFSILIFSLALADHHKDRERRQGRHGSKHLPPVNNETYKQQCGACHFAYQPGLLPSGSWERLLAQLPSHFGEEVEMDADSKIIIEGYLRSNAAEYSDVKRSRKAAKTAGNATPLRITETTYFRHEHHELNPSIFARKSIGSRSNCVACHTTAEQGVYDDR